MRKIFKIVLLNLFVLMGFSSYSQCTVTAVSSSNDVQCGQSVDLNAIGVQGSLVMDNDFDLGNAGNGWGVTSAADFTNPCGAGPGGSYMWMGSTSPAPRTLTTTDFDMSCGGQVCFDLRMAEQGGASPCEGPDLPTEGVDFQYSIDNGATWVTINYFDPGNGFDPLLTTWDNYCFNLPSGAWSTNTIFQWTQSATSSNLNDHWGIDNVQILSNDCGYYYDWDHLPGSPDLSSGGSVSPSSTTTYNVIYTNGVDSCYSSVTVNVLFPDIDVTASPSIINTCGGCTDLEGNISNIPPDSCCFTLDMQDSFGDGWNGGFLNVNLTSGQTLGPFSADNNGSVINFCLLDGETFTLEYTSGNWEGENTYEVLDPSGNVIFGDGPNPTTGNVYNDLVDCGTPPLVYVWDWVGQGLTPINDSTQTGCPTTSSWYYLTLSSGGCSSTDSVYIDYNGSPVNSTTDIDLCSGSNYTFPDGTVQNNILSDVTQVSTLVGGSVLGCDSIITTNISIVPSINVNNNFNVCSGESYTFPDGTIQTNITSLVTQVSNFITSGGCDSIITTTIDVNPIHLSTDNVTICSGSDYTFPDGSVELNILSPMSHINNMLTVDGCDSIVTTNISLYPSYNVIEDINLCSGESYTFPDGSSLPSITVPTSYISNLVTVDGCDSIITTNITIDPVYNISNSFSICSGSDYTFPDGSTVLGISSPMTHISNMLTVNGCDSTIITNIDILPSITNTVDIDLCSGSDYTFADGIIETNIISSISHISNLVTNDGCDSIVTENININPVYDLVENIDQCPNLDYTFPDGTVQNNITSNISHVSNLVTIYGCDSIITTNVNVYDVPSFDITFTPNGCSPLDITITNNTLGSNCNWSISGPGLFNDTYSSCGQVNSVYDNAGFYDVDLSMESVDGCPMDTSIVGAFEVYPLPFANFTWSPNEGNLVTDDRIEFTNLSLGDNSFWDFGDGATSTQPDITHTYLDSGNYNVTLIVTNDYGCSDTTNNSVVINQTFLLYVPNTFTPHRDQINNIFLPIISGHDPGTYTLLIFNRWGELLFQTDNSDEGWDGTYNSSPVQIGTYIWRIKVKSEGRPKEYIGHINVIR